MRIAKKSTNSATNTANISAKPVVDVDELECQDALEAINSAIRSLGKHAKNSVIAKEAIANLSVVYFDLQKNSK